MKLAIGCDEAAYRLKVIIMEHLKEKHAEIEVTDFGVAQGNTVLYPNVAYTVADAVASGGFQRGILLCGTGIGMCICANKVPSEFLLQTEITMLDSLRELLAMTG